LFSIFTVELWKNGIRMIIDEAEEDEKWERKSSIDVISYV
jgi:hypothetical protein